MMLKALKSVPNQALACEEYEKATTVTTIQGRGRGLIADEEILAGELILACRALAIVYHDEGSQLASPLLTRVKRFRLLKEAVAESVKHSLESAIKVYQLNGGPKIGHLSPEEIERRFQENPVDTARIEGICLVNALSSIEGPNGSHDLCGGSFGLWDRASYINHDCCNANATWMIINDFVFVRAAKNIHRRSEILISYIDPHQMYSAKREMFLKHDFICKCKLCKTEANEDQELRCARENLLCKIISECENGSMDDPESITLSLTKLNSLMCNNEISLNKVYKMKPLIFLGLSYYESNNFMEAFDAFHKAFEVCGSFVQLNPAKLFLAVAMSRAILKCGRHEELQNWIRTTKLLVVEQYGDEDNYDIFSHLYADFVKQMERSGVNVRDIYDSQID